MEPRLLIHAVTGVADHEARVVPGCQPVQAGVFFRKHHVPGLDRECAAARNQTSVPGLPTD